MKYLVPCIVAFLLFSCSSYKNVSYHENDDIYHRNTNDTELVVNNITTTRFVNVYQNDFIYTPFYVTDWYNPYWGWNSNWSWYNPYWGWNRFYYNWSWYTWNQPNVWNHPNYWGWNQPYQYNPYVWNRGRRGNYFSSRHVEPGRLTPSTSIRPNRNPSVRPATQPRSNPSVRPATQPRSNPSVRPATQPRSNPSVRPATQPRSNPSRVSSGRN